MPKESEGKPVGDITHYFGNIGVAVIKLTGSLKNGDSIQVVGGETDFTQAVDSMEVDRQKVAEAKKGDSVGLKINQKVREGYKVYKL